MGESLDLEEIVLERSKVLETLITEYLEHGVENFEGLKRLKRQRSYDAGFRKPFDSVESQLKPAKSLSMIFRKTLPQVSTASVFSCRPKSSYRMPKVDFEKESQPGEEPDEEPEIASMAGESISDNQEAIEEKNVQKILSQWHRKMTSEGKSPRRSYEIVLEFQGLTKRNREVRDVKVLQQIAYGRAPLTIFSRKMRCQEELTVSPYCYPEKGSLNLTILVDNIRDARVSVCCPFKYKLKAKIGHFMVKSIVEGRPCSSCEVKTCTVKNREKAANKVFKED